MPFTNFFEGKNSSVTISASSRTMDSIDLKYKAEIIDTGNFTSNGFQTNRAGFKNCDANWGGPYDGVSGHAEGDSIGVIFACGGSGPSFTQTQRISEIGLSVKARNAVWREEVTSTSNGEYSVSI